MYKLFKKLRSGGTLHKLPIPEYVTVHYVLNCCLLSILHRKHEGRCWAMTLPDVDFDCLASSIGNMRIVVGQ
jgi:hypothetical protein